MNLQKSFSALLLVFCSIFNVKCGILYPEEDFDTATPSITNVPPSLRDLVNKLMEVTEKLNRAADSDVSFHPLVSNQGEFEFGLGDIKADPYVTGLDLIWSSTQDTCKLVIAGDNFKLHGKLRYGYIFFDLDHLLTEGHSVQDIVAKILPSPHCQAEDPFTNSFLMVYRNVTKLELFQELDNLTVSRMKRDVEKLDFGKRIPKTSSGTDNSGCRLVPWTVDFVKMNWDRFITFPKTYQANSCEGRCPPMMIPTANDLHSVCRLTNYEILRMLSGEKPGENRCKPAKFGSQALLFYKSSETVVLKTIPNMRVLECECSICSSD